MTLDRARNRDIFIIKKIKQEPKMKKRLQDLGLTKGAKVKVLSNDTSGSFILNVRGSRVVLGKVITESIFVETIDNTDNNYKDISSAC
jgi:ferrous iron transport protein A